MSELHQLTECETTLKASGVRDVKFFFGPVSDREPSKAYTDVAKVMKAILNKDVNLSERLPDYKERVK